MKSAQKGHNTCLSHYKLIRCEVFSSLQSLTNRRDLIQTLTTLILHRNCIGTEGAQCLAGALESNTVRNTFLFIVVYRSLLLNRHSPRWILATQVLVKREHIICLTHYKATWLDIFSSWRFHIDHDHLIQTLSTLDLGHNQIDAKEAQHLATALQNNTVRYTFFLSILHLSTSFNTDTHYTESLEQQNRWWRDAIFGPRITA
jgi:hypothetical protein